jgi:hypothetical protein
LLFKSPLTPAIGVPTSSPLAERSARLPAIKGIQQLGAQAGEFPYLAGLVTAYRLEVMAEEMADTLDTAPGNKSAEYFAIGPRMWSQPGQLYRARGRQLYSQRIGTVEPVFANIRHNKRLTRFNHRGREKVNTQWNLYCMVHNIEKLAKTGYAQ